jgi:hypothetical protein
LDKEKTGHPGHDAGFVLSYDSHCRKSFHRGEYRDFCEAITDFISVWQGSFFENTKQLVSTVNIFDPMRNFFYFRLLSGVETLKF